MEQPEKRIDILERRIKKLELFSHAPVDWEKKIKSLEASITRLYDLFNNKEK